MSAAGSPRRIQTSADDPQNPVPGSVNNITGESGTLSPGGTINGGKIRFVVVDHGGRGWDDVVDVAAGNFLREHARRVPVPAARCTGAFTFSQPYR